MKISLIGSGNVATVLGRKIRDAGHEVIQVFSPNKEHAALLAAVLHANHSSNWENIDRTADLHIVAVADKAILPLADRLSLQEKFVVHTAGSVSREALHKISKNYGVIYPLQSLRKEVKDFPVINVLVDANTPDNRALIYDFAKTFADHVVYADDDARLKLHVAAVIVSNFSNHLYSLAANYCEQEALNFQLLLPLIVETATRLYHASPGKMQTGPAARHDFETIQKHLELLNGHPQLKRIYDVLSNSISGAFS